ncbi:MAG: hypothetical protein MZV70_74285 [Desulfobacterales bacterium]|nr:hypothetical protein [Desulfobacterales bacterium]
MKTFRCMFLCIVLVTGIGVSPVVAEGVLSEDGGSEISLQTLRTSREKQQVLARYAKGFFFTGSASALPCRLLPGRHISSGAAS